MDISIVLPVYNKARYLPSLLDDLRAQTFQRFECILVDDGSADGSGELCDRAVEQDSRFRVFHLANGGVSRARNLGMDHARGTYLTFIDADDRVHPAYLQNLYECLKQSGADLVIGSYEKVWENPSRRQKVRLPYSGLASMKTLLPSFAEIQRASGIFGYCWAKLFPRRLAQGLRFDESLKLAEDFAFYLKLYPLVRTVWFDEKPYYAYLQAAENSSVQVHDDQIDYMAQLWINLLYRAFLTEQDAYSGKNREIVDGLLSSYVYFSLFYCPETSFSERFAVLRELVRQERIPLQRQQGAFRKSMLCLLRLNCRPAAQGLLQGYRLVRKIVRRK